MNRLFALVTLLAALLAGCAPPQQTAVVTERPVYTPPADTVADVAGQPTMPATLGGLDTVTVGRFDAGKMWTFEDPPLDLLEEAYGFRPDAAWLERARLGALRFAGYCSASFVSPRGLVMTNHHCARESLAELTRPGENLLEAGFYAATQEGERRVPDLYVDQLVAFEDVTAEVSRGVGEVADDDRRAARLQEVTDRIERRLTAAAKEQDTTLFVQLVPLYSGGRYSAYTYRRYRDVRLVMAPEMAVAHFGGEFDNFTYPRYSLDFAFFRAYTPEGTPVASQNYFPWCGDCADEGEAVFVVGNPGNTSRLGSVAQLEYARAYALPQELAVLRSRADILAAYLEENPEAEGSAEVRSEYLSLLNSIKANEGQLAGLHDPYLVARRTAAETALAERIAATDSLRTRYGGVLSQLAEVQRAKAATASLSAAFTGFGSPLTGSRILTRAYYAYYHDFWQQRGATPEWLEENLRTPALAVESLPPEVEEAFIAARLRELQTYLGPTDPTLRRVLGSRTPESVAEEVVAGTVLKDSTGLARIFDEGYRTSGDPTVPLINAIAPLYSQHTEQAQNFAARERNLEARLARARFALYGTRIPPDASFSLRIADGVVRGYAYNGTVAPPKTTFYGLYGHYYAYGAGTAWDLPARWLTPPPGFDRSTPVNLVSTNDITGGNSGSPLLNRNLEIVGLVFDGNIESLPNQYLFLDVRARAVSVDARGILEALAEIYGANRLVAELTGAPVGE